MRDQLMTDHWHFDDASVGCTYTQFVQPFPTRHRLRRL